MYIGALVGWLVVVNCCSNLPFPWGREFSISSVLRPSQSFEGGKKLCQCRDFRSGKFTNKFPIPANSMSRSPQPYLLLASHVSATSFSLQFVCLSLHRSQDLPTFTICWLQVLSFVLWHRILERPPQMPSWRSTALNRPILFRPQLKLFSVNFQRSWNCFLVNVVSVKLKAKISGKSILVGRPANARNSLQFPRSLYSPPFLSTFTPDVRSLKHLSPKR